MEEKLCCRCHEAPATKRGYCAVCSAAYYREYYEKNKEKRREQSKAWYHKQLETLSGRKLKNFRRKLRERSARYAAEHPEKRAAHNAKFREILRQRYREAHPYARMTKAELWEQNVRLRKTLERLLENPLPVMTAEIINETLAALEAGKEN